MIDIFLKMDTPLGFLSGSVWDGFGCLVEGRRWLLLKTGKGDPPWECTIIPWSKCSSGGNMPEYPLSSEIVWMVVLLTCPNRKASPLQYVSFLFPAGGVTELTFSFRLPHFLWCEFSPHLPSAPVSTSLWKLRVLGFSCSTVLKAPPIVPLSQLCPGQIIGFCLVSLAQSRVRNNLGLGMRDILTPDFIQTSSRYYF